jgi:Flp pilus assembly protein TadG
VKGSIDERGQSALEFAILAPVVLAVVLLIVAGARLVGARGDLDATAREAARAGVEAPPTSAGDVARQVGQATALGYGMDPSRLELVADPNLTRGGTYVVVARYRVSLAPMPGSVTVEARRTEPVDPFRSFGGVQSAP